jgi:DNA-directed RNA polymerase specialized sigma subunit
MLYEWLKDYQKLEEEISYLEYRVERSKKELWRWVHGDLQGVPLQRESIAANLEEIIEKIEYELAHKMNDLLNLKKLISTFRGLDNNIIKLKYIDGMSLEEIAEELTYSFSHIKKKHAELVRTIRFVERYHLGSLQK